VFIGHLALGFAAKRATPRVSLAMLVLASQWADMLWPVCLALGLEQVRIDPGNTAMTPLDFVSYPYSHSLAALIVWGIAIGAVYRAIAGGRRTVWVLGTLVISHWVLDYVTHRPDMPLYPGSAKYGLELWRSIPATVAVESVMFAVGVWIYVRSTRARDAVGRWGLIALVALLVVAYIANIVAGPPPSLDALWIGALAGAAVLTALAWWADAHREPV
jgi:membrane-bound metal-dependent hydrolase YbcI (DUF457 family)